MSASASSKSAQKTRVTLSATRTKIVDALYPPPTYTPCLACGGQVVAGLMDHHLEHQCKSRRARSQRQLGPLESADGAKENVDEIKKKLDENEKLRAASMQMLEGIVFKLLVSTRQEASTFTWHGSANTTQSVDMVSATLGTDSATRQQVLASLVLTLLTLTLQTARSLAHALWPAFHRSSFASRLSFTRPAAA